MLLVSVKTGAKTRLQWLSKHKTSIYRILSIMMFIFQKIASSSGPDVSCSTSVDIAEACQSRCHIASNGGAEEMRLLDTKNGKYRL